MDMVYTTTAKIQTPPQKYDKIKVSCSERPSKSTNNKKIMITPETGAHYF